MGWADCGNDSQGRPIGYGFEATCDHPGCEAKIDRGLSYVCGNMHGQDDWSCEKYFCQQHRLNWIKNDDDDVMSVCSDCEKYWRENNPEAAKAFDEE